MSLFNINWRTQVTNLLPSFKRSTSVIDYITSLLEPLKTAAITWFAFDVETRKRAKFNSQIIILRAALNNVFGISVAPFIDIQNNTSIGQTIFIYNSAEGFNPTYIYNSNENRTNYFFNSAEVGSTFAFTVLIPVSIYTAELERQVTAEVESYKLAGLSFDVQTY